MIVYTMEFNDGTGECFDLGFYDNNTEAEIAAETVLERRGYDPNEFVTGDWQVNGVNDDGQELERCLFWESAEDAENDPGANWLASVERIVRKP